jgi:hypothetical protein
MRLSDIPTGTVMLSLERDWDNAESDFAIFTFGEEFPELVRQARRALGRLPEKLFGKDASLRFPTDACTFHTRYHPSFEHPLDYDREVAELEQRGAWAYVVLEEGEEERLRQCAEYNGIVHMCLCADAFWFENYMSEQHREESVSLSFDQVLTEAGHVKINDMTI